MACNAVVTDEASVLFSSFFIFLLLLVCLLDNASIHPRRLLLQVNYRYIYASFSSKLNCSGFALQKSADSNYQNPHLANQWADHVNEAHGVDQISGTVNGDIDAGHDLVNSVALQTDLLRNGINHSINTQIEFFSILTRLMDL